MGAAYTRPYHVALFARDPRTEPGHAARRSYQHISRRILRTEDPGAAWPARKRTRHILAWRRESAAFLVAPGFSGRLFHRRLRDRLLHFRKSRPANVCRFPARSVQNFWSHRTDYRNRVFA